MKRMRMSVLAAAGAALVVASAGGTTASAQPSASPLLTAPSTVVVPQGQPVQIAFVGSSDFPAFTHDFRNGIQMAIEQHPMIRGHSIQVNESDPPCFSGPDPAAANVAAANAIVSNLQNTAVIGHICSVGFAPALPIYEDADVVTISGSATATDLPSLGPDVFNRTAVADPNFDAWYPLVTALPSDLAFRQNYQSEFGASPLGFTDLYFDATSLLLMDLQKVSRVVNGNLVIDRAALASAVRHTANFQGVTCTITLDPSTGNRVDDPASLARCAED
jgi:ABC-type branched-subunit amino acid transport system substrate-binding protein